MPPPAKPRVAKKEAPLDPWVLTTLNADDEGPALLWNGLVGFRIGRDASGKGQPFFSIDEYNSTGEEKIRSMTSPLPNGFLVDGKPVPVTGDYRQSLDMRTSELSTHWQSGAIGVDCVTVLHPSKKTIAQRWTLTGLTPEHLLDFDLGSNGKFGKLTMFESDILVGPSKMKGKVIATLTQTPNPTVEYVLSLGISPNIVGMAEARGLHAQAQPGMDRAPSLEQFSMVEDETKSVWKERWKSDIEIDGPVEDQQAVRSFLFYLRSAIHPGAGMSVSPFGLSNQKYNGHVFWDADVWIFPALMLIDPAEAKAIPDYRIATLPTAIRNQMDTLPPPTQNIGNYAKFPWESSVSGLEVAPENWRDELHIIGDVAWCMNQAAALGIEPQAEALSIMNASAGAFDRKTIHFEKGHELEIHGITSIDEEHHGDNDLYTNLLAQWVANYGSWHTAPKYHLPQDATSFLTYDDDKIKVYKQAAAVLSIYPLQYPPAEKEAKIMMDRFPPKVIPDGPAMTESIHALIWARIGELEKAYAAWQKGWKQCTKQPLMLFTENRQRKETYFTTGAGGSLQTVLFGFFGFRLDSLPEQGAAWSKQLRGNNWLSIKPNLPLQWKSVKVKNFTVLGHRYTLTATHRPTGPDAAQVIQGD